MTAIKTVADLKRALQVGTQIEMVRYNGQAPTGKLAGVGTISKVQTNGVWIKRGENKSSWLDFPKASEFMPSIERAGHFEISSGGNYPIVLEYKIIS